ncbi:MAG: GatB/YqeY domain-containing protein [Deltaproteobacteria bacterium]|nr:GatB/YqeY domain-containing protein [Deltaproteobacteria bacterium]
MPLEQLLNDMLKEAMRAKDAKTAGVVRMLKTKVMEKRTSKGFTGEVTDAVVEDVIAAYKKQLQKAIGEFAGSGDKGKEQVEEMEFEISFCDKFLPKGMDAAALEVAVKEAITTAGATEPAQAGKVVGAFMKLHKGKADAADVKKLAEKLLTK